MRIPNPFSRRDLASLPLNFFLVGQQISITQRRNRYARASMRHPGKMLPLLARKLVEEYTNRGDWILDPMSGIGTTGVEAVHLDRNYVGIELEPRWVKLQQANLALAREQGATGDSHVICADSRRLATSDRLKTSDIGRIDAVITSPPYGDRLGRARTPSPVMLRLINQRKMRADIIPATYGARSGHLGNLPYHQYLEQMRVVYAGCQSVLKPGGLLILVVRPGRDRGRLRPLHHDTARLCVELGFEFLDERVAILARIDTRNRTNPAVYAHSLFFKRLAVAHLREAGHPVSLEQLEYVLVFRKPGETGERSKRSNPKHKSGLSTALAEPATLRTSKEDLVSASVMPARFHPTSITATGQIPCQV